VGFFLLILRLANLKIYYLGSFLTGLSCLARYKRSEGQGPERNIVCLSYYIAALPYPLTPETDSGLSYGREPGMTKDMNIKQISVLALAFASALAATSAGAAQRLVVEKNHSTRITLGGSAGSVIVANPDIADVTVIDSRTVYIVGKGFGNSSIVITDKAGRPLFDGEIVVTSIQKGAITVYKGLKPSLMVCSSICTSEEANTTNAAGASAPVIFSPPPAGAGGATAMVVQ